MQYRHLERGLIFGGSARRVALCSLLSAKAPVVLELLDSILPRSISRRWLMVSIVIHGGTSLATKWMGLHTSRPCHLDDAPHNNEFQLVLGGNLVSRIPVKQIDSIQIYSSVKLIRNKSIFL